MIECKKPYLPPVIASAPSYLVVEGAINTGLDSTIIHLSNTIALSSPDGTTPPPVLNATVVIQSDANANYPLTSSGNGYYTTTGLNLSASNKYRLQITISDNKVYRSDFVAVKNAQAIDSLSYQVENNGVQINVNTHDPSNDTRYYRWDYSETWIIHAEYQSLLMVVTSPVDTIVPRDAAHEIYRCWQSDRSSDIILASTSKLSSDVLGAVPITLVPSNSEKFTERYSILVKQYALTPDAYNYYLELRKNTEELGGIFDPQPTTLTGNIHCITNPAEQVIGYITAGVITQKRIFISSSTLPAFPQWQPITPYNDCQMYTYLYFNPVTKNNDIPLYFYNGNKLNIPIAAVKQPGKPIIGYTSSSGICVDCTLRGTNKQPGFWTDQ